MCGRFTLTLPDYETLARALGVEPDPELAPLYRPRFNVAPTDRHWILRVRDGRRELVPGSWGLVNAWAADRSGASKQLLARAETVATRPAYRDAFRRRRCLVPADGFFEWGGPKGRRQPYWFHSKDGGLLLLAGLYESWRDRRTGLRERTFAIVTTPANDVVGGVHDRMPALVPIERASAWLGAGSPEAPSPDEIAAAEALLAPAPAELLEPRRVSRRVNDVAHDDPACLEPEAPAPEAPPAESSVLPLFDRAAARHPGGQRSGTP